MGRVTFKDYGGSEFRGSDSVWTDSYAIDDLIVFDDIPGAEFHIVDCVVDMRPEVKQPQPKPKPWVQLNNKPAWLRGK